MQSNNAGSLAEILRTTLHLVEQRRDLDQQAPSIQEMKESMRKTIAELDERKLYQKPEKKPVKRSWTQALRRRKRGSSA